MSRTQTSHGAKVQRDIGRAERERPLFLAACRAVDIPEPVWEWRFALPEHQWRFDYAWPEARVALEVQGGIFIHGGHNRGPQYAIDMQKFNEACARGWLVLQCVPGGKDSVGYRKDVNGNRTVTPVWNVPALLNLSTPRLVKRVIAARVDPLPVTGAHQRRLEQERTR
jgi:hypothetical protein